MTFVDLIKDFIDTSKERLKTPISGAFIWAFLIWNWRPIVLLLFSEQTIEDRIQIIDQYFCTLSAILGPIGLALFYTIAIPAIMIGVDWVLEPVKKIRIGRIYKSKDFVTDEKIKLARKEFELKNIETGNKQIEDFQRRIRELQDDKEQLIATQEELNISRNEAVDSLRRSSTVVTDLEQKIQKLNQINENAYQLTMDLVRVLSKLNPEEIDSLIAIKESFGDEMLIKTSELTIDKFRKLGLVAREDGYWNLTNLGSLLINRIENIK